MSILLTSDLYKCGHYKQYPEGTTKVYSYFCSRGTRVEGVKEVVFFGLQYYIKKYLMQPITNNDKDEFVRRVSNALGPNALDDKILSDIDKLIELGHLPLKIKALPEGSRAPLGVAMFTITNTHPDFYWLTNFVETILMKCWHTCTAATTSYRFKQLCKRYSDLTCDNDLHLPWQCHDFSYRSLSSDESGCLSGAGHLLNFDGTDTLGAISLVEDYYGELVGGSVGASEHSVMCMYGRHGELEAFSRLMDVYPEGIVSIVSDTYNLWNVLTNILPQLRDKILSRNGKVVIRPDSSPKTPLEIICGDYEASCGTPEYMGCLDMLWDEFGGTYNSKGYRVLDPHIGLIYGDAISYEMAEKILDKIDQMGYASSNIVFGIGGYNYQYVTRDTYNFALKATYGEIDGRSVEIFKDPITDKKKKSAKGLLSVYKRDEIFSAVGENQYYMLDERTSYEEENSELQTVFENGVLLKDYTYSEVKNNLK